MLSKAYPLPYLKTYGQYEPLSKESELVAGYFTEHSGMIFVFFFLAEYCSIVLMSALTSIFFLGGYVMPQCIVNNTFINVQAVVLALKTCLFCFVFVWFRATLPRLRYDQLMQFCWMAMLPVAIACFVLVLCLLVAFDVTPCITRPTPNVAQCNSLANLQC